MYHVAIGHMLGIVLVGGCSVLLTEQVNPQFIVETVAKERVTVAFLLVPWATDLVEAFDKRTLKIEDYDLSSWRLTHMGAQPIPPALVKRFKAYFPTNALRYEFWIEREYGAGNCSSGYGKREKDWRHRETDSYVGR